MTKKKTLLLMVAILIGISYKLIAEEIQLNSVDELVTYSLNQNVELKSYLKEWEAAKEVPKKLGGLPDPMIGVRLNGSPAKDNQNEFDQKRYIIQQSFPFLGERAKLKKLGNQKAEIAYLNYAIKRNQIATETQTQYYALILNKKLTEITRKNKDLMIKLYNIADVKYQSGIGSQANLLKAKVAIGKFDAELLTLNHQNVSLKEALRQLLSLNPDQNLNLSFDYPKKRPTEIMRPTPDWLSQLLVVQKSDAKLRESKQASRAESNRFTPDFSLQLEYWDNTTMENQHSGQLMMSLPFINPKNYAAKNEAKKKVEASRHRLAEDENQSYSKLVSMVSEINTLSQMIDLYTNQILKDARLSLANFKQAFEVDKASFIEYFESEMTLFQLEKNVAVLKYRYHNKIAELNGLFEKGELPK